MNAPELKSTYTRSQKSPSRPAIGQIFKGFDQEK